MTDVPARLAANQFITGQASHITVQPAPPERHAILLRCCPAQVYTLGPDDAVHAEYAACLECGTCLALANPDALAWRYPEGGHGVAYRWG